jgi:pimeloyl-ACP methyl ester carboxylesterase
LNDCLNRSGITLANQLTTPTIILYGEQEAVDFPKIKSRTLETKRLAKNVKVLEVHGAPHDIDFPAYREAIENLF